MESFWAVDCGATAARVVRIRRTAQGLALDRAGLFPVPGAAGSRPPEPDPDRLRQWLREKRLKPRRAVSRLGGGQALLRAFLLPPAPPWRLELMIRYEIEHQLNQDPEAVIWNYHVLDLPAAISEMAILAGLVKKEAAVAHLAWLKRAGIGGEELTLSPLALFALQQRISLATSDELNLLVNIGATATDLVLERQGRLVFARSLPVGGDRFTAAVADTLQLDPEAAERFKRERGEILADPEAAEEAGRALSRALGQAAEELAQGVQSTLHYCQTQFQLESLALARVLLTGGGARLKGLDGFLSSRLEVPVEPLAWTRGFDLGPLPPEERKLVEAQPEAFALAVGQGAGALAGSREMMTFVTPEERARRHFFRRTVFLWYGAACFLAALAFLLYGSLHSRSFHRRYLANLQRSLKAAQDERINHQPRIQEADSEGNKVAYLTRLMDRPHRLLGFLMEIGRVLSDPRLNAVTVRGGLDREQPPALALTVTESGDQFVIRGTVTLRPARGDSRSPLHVGTETLRRFHGALSASGRFLPVDPPGFDRGEADALNFWMTFRAAPREGQGGPGG